MAECKILLIEPPFYRLFKESYSLTRYPLSLGYLAGSILKNTGWVVSVYNADFSPKADIINMEYLTHQGFEIYRQSLNSMDFPIWKEIEQRIRTTRPDAVGVTVKSQNFKSACMVASLVKKVDKSIPVIAGGPHISMVGVDSLNHPDIDIIVKGEGENAIVEILAALETDGDLGRVKGISFRKDGGVIDNPIGEFIEDLDSLSFPAQNAEKVLIDYPLYPVTAFKNIFAIRGCAYNCFFCGSRNIWHRKVRARSVGNVVAEINFLRKKGLQSVNFDDDTFGVTKKRIYELCEGIKIGSPGLKWSCELHVKLIDKDILHSMKQAGCYAVQIGVESGSNEILKIMRKQITIEEAISASSLIKKTGIESHIFFMVGFPHETEADIEKTYQAMKKLKCDKLNYSIFTPYPGTEAFELCRDKGLIDSHYDPSLYNHQSPENCFCLNIAPARFRVLVSKIEKMVDKKNKMNRLKRILSFNSIWRIKELGLKKSLHKGMRILVGP